MKINNLICVFISIISLSCDITSSNDFAPNTVSGCTDPDASNYNPDANVDDGTCYYIEYNTQISIGKENELVYIEIYDYPKIAGFQFDLHLNGDDLQVTTLNAFGGVSEEANFIVSTGLEMLRVLGFNLTGETIDSTHLDSNRLVYLDIETNGSGLIGLQNVIISGENGSNIPVNINPALISIP